MSSWFFEGQTLPNRRMESSDFKYKFFEAVEANDMDKVQMMIKEKYVDLDVTNDDYEKNTALHLSALFGHLDLIRILVEEHGADINRENLIGEIPLHLAANHDHMEVVNYLMKKKSKYSEDVEEFFRNRKK